MPDLIQFATWPGVKAVAACTYVCGHGITPGKAVLTSYPQDDAPQEYGTLHFTDGVRKFTVPACKVDSVTPQMGPGGTTFTLEILDERWSWAFGGIDGHYNQKDGRGKLVPWTIRSPQELALLCLKAMKVTRYDIRALPKGLSRKDGKNVERYLKTGENFPQTLTNPETFWDHIPPAQALAQLADFYGLRVIYQPNAAKVILAYPGKGKDFPNLPYESIGGTIDGPEAPAFVGVVGAPVKFQSRFLLEAVGEDWDGEILPIEDLSYAPTGNDVKAVFEVRKTGDDTDKGASFFFKVTFAGGKGDNFQYFRTEPFGNYVDKFQRIVGYANASDFISKYSKWELITTGDDAVIRITAKTTDLVEVSTLEYEVGVNRPCKWNAVIPIVKPENKKERWNDCKPPFFPTVRATNRLSYEQSKQLAAKSVFRYYRIMNRDAHDKGQIDKPGRPIEIAQWGKILRRQQIVLLNSKVEQVKPAPRIAGAGGGQAAPAVAGFGALPDFYNGYSRDQPNTVAGSVWKKIGAVNWLWDSRDPNAVGPNTDPEKRVFVDFDIDPVEQIVRFAEPVFYFGGDAPGGITRQPSLVLECGHYVLDPETNVPIRWLETLRVLGGTAPVQWQVREDVSVGVVGVYGPQDKLVGTDYLDLADARGRAGYYLRGMAAQYKITGGESRQYIGIVPHDPDGFCQQVSVTVGDSGPTTIVSGNTEFHPAIPPYPARRRAELLPADKAGAAANLAERDFLLGPLPPGMR